MLPTYYIFYSHAINFTSCRKKLSIKRKLTSHVCVSGINLRDFRFYLCTVGKRGTLEGSCVRVPASASAFFPFSSWSPPSSLDICSSSFHELLSFSLAGNEFCCLWCQGEPGGGNSGAERKCQPLCTHICVCVYPFSRVIKDPILHTHTHSPFEPLQRN